MSELNIPTAQEIRTSAFPEYTEFDAAIEKGICDTEDFSDTYLQIQALYRKVLEEYLMEELELAKYEQQVEDTGMGFVPMPDERKNFYHKYSTMELEYLYLRNNVHVERLSAEDLAVFQAQLAAGSAETTPELRDIVLDTFPEVLGYYSMEKYLSGKQAHLYLYSKNGRIGAEHNAVVLIFRASGAYDENGMTIDRENEIAKDEYIREEWLPAINTALEGKLEVPVRVFSEP